MLTLREYTKNSCIYTGDREEWLVAYTQHRDSDNLDKSNFAYIVKALAPEDDTFAIERFSHFAVGWLEYALVHPEATHRISIMEDIVAKLADYPVLDEDDYSAREAADEDCNISGDE